jgi:polyisoprenoid-binding protein YceI
MSHSIERSIVVAASIAVSLAVAAVASARLVKSGPASAGFKVAGPAGMSVEGKASTVTVSEDGGALGVTVALGGLTTGIGLRDKHMRDALEVDRYPTAELRVPRAALKVPASGDASGDARGTMKLHGQSKDVTLHYTARREGAQIVVRGTAHINMNDFGIKTPTYLGVGLKPDVDLASDFAVKDE